MDFTSNKPIYRQIIDYSFNKILSGEWSQGERVPSVRELASRLAVNTHTVLKAMEYLQQQEIIYPQRGMGFFLTVDAREKVNAERRRRFFDEHLPTLFRDMEILGITIDEITARYSARNKSD